ncbi:MAG: hypothetical protein GAK31_02094 [Stenotrophomonas maltophilia]|uniref:Transmembrane protein n=1 Tax=Stenotrophomonas maltophilia TaxID=40324 RepID=A0A7V8FFI8_STEMA|nr:MAG: hypothetical protein GAK31_02094 [Stenotrophomonas maltophilia]
MNDLPNALGRSEQVAMRMGYLCIVQGIITRMAASGTAMQGFAVAIPSAMLALSATQDARFHWAFFLMPGLTLLVLHAYFLRQERTFIRLYNIGAAQPLERVLMPIIDASRLRQVREPWMVALASPSVTVFHLSVTFAFVLSYLYAKGGDRCFLM